MLGVIGQSGAGKTTLLKILAGLEEPTSGTVTYKGTALNAAGAASLRREATMLFQTPLFLRGDVYTNLAYGLRLREVSETVIASRVSDALNRVRLPGFERRDAYGLSGGEAQRAALARALVLDPRVLLLDEPTSNLDPSNVSIISDIISEESKGKTVVLATHDYSQIKKLARYVVHLEGGKVVGRGETSDLMSAARYADNVFTGDARTEGGVTIVDVGGAAISAAFRAEGRISIRISPEDIIVSRIPLESSARNRIQGRITSIEESGQVIRLRVEAGREFAVQLTRRSLVELGLNVGGEVYLSFKASSVELA